jgi:hypothetical protein
MGTREKWIMTAIVVAIAFYAFGFKALLLCGVGGLAFLIARPNRPHHR